MHRQTAWLVWIKRWGIALILFLSAIGAALAEPRSQRDPFRKNACFSLDFREGIVVKNGHVESLGREYKYGDRCTAFARGQFCVIERASGYVAARYTAQQGHSESGECPTGTQTSFTLRELEDKQLVRVQEDEREFFRSFHPKIPE